MAFQNAICETKFHIYMELGITGRIEDETLKHVNLVRPRFVGFRLKFALSNNRDVRFDEILARIS